MARKEVKKWRRKYRASKIKAGAAADSKGTGHRTVTKQWRCGDEKQLTEDRYLWKQELEKYAKDKFTDEKQGAEQTLIV